MDRNERPVFEAADLVGENVDVEDARPRGNFLLFVDVFNSSVKRTRASLTPASKFDFFAPSVL
jgi:hypothetical protein